MDTTGFFEFLGNALEVLENAGSFFIDFYDLLPLTWQNMLLAMFVILFGFAFVLMIFKILR